MKTCPATSTERPLSVQLRDFRRRKSNGRDAPIRVEGCVPSRIEAREADQLGEPGVGDIADMRAERKPALAEDFLDAVLPRGAQPVVCLRMNCFIRSIAGAA